MRTSANRTVVASHTEEHATSLSPSACPTLYYYPTLSDVLDALA
jgi:hypothetical protein